MRCDSLGLSAGMHAGSSTYVADAIEDSTIAASPKAKAGD